MFSSFNLFQSSRLIPILASAILTIPAAQAAVVFSDDFSEADGTLIDGKAPDVGNAWSAPSSTLAISNSSLDTSGAGRTVFGGFASSLAAGQILTLTYDTIAVGGGNFFSGGYAGVSLFVGGDERVFTGDTGAGATWGVDSGAIGSAILSQDSTATTTATFSYAYDTGDWSFTTTSGVDLSGVGQVGEAFSQLRIANGSGGDIRVDNVVVDISAVPEPSAYVLFGIAGLSLGFLRRR